MEATFWALVPPILAIIISLITKEVNLSLVIGILVGCGLYCSFNPFNDQLLPLTAITTAAVLGGAVCGDHISPISDTTILSSTGAGCSHINHVSTQMQYGLIAAAISVVCYVVSGITESTAAGFFTGAVVLVFLILGTKKYYSNKE